jgi:putative ABC transport system permease protein
MFLNYLRLSVRTFSRNRAPFIINLLGMSVALGLCIAAWVNYEFNSQFDEHQADVKNIYRLSFNHATEKGTKPYGVSPMPLGKLVAGNNSEINQIIRYISKDAQFRINDDVFKKEFIYADPSFVSIFHVDLLHGSLNLSDKSHVLISDKLAKTYFGIDDVVGNTLLQIINGVPKEFTISGVFKQFPSNSSFRFHLLTNFDNYFTDPSLQSVVENDWKRWTTTFVEVKDARSLPRITKQLQQFIKPQNEARPDLMVTNYFLEPFEGMSYRAVKERNEGHWFNSPMPPAAVIAPFAMAGFLLLVACFNFTNNAIAVAGKRLKEIGIRKVIGGRRKELIIQFLAETFFFTVAALAVALVLAEFFIKGWDAMWPGIEMSIVYEGNYIFMVVLLMLVLICSLLAGSYPAFYISAFKPIAILKGTTRFGGTNGLTKTLLVFQFTIALAAVIFALAFYHNAKFQKEFDLGYSYQTVIQVPLENSDQYHQLKNELQHNSDIKFIGGSEHHIYRNSTSASARNEKLKEKEVDVLNVGENYLETLNVKIISGRGFDKDQASDLTEAIIVNEEFVRAFDLQQNAIGQRITLNDTAQYYIIGITKDVFLKALFKPLSPLIFKYSPEDNYRYLVVSTDLNNLASVDVAIQLAWRKLFPNTLYNGEPMEAEMAAAMEHFDNVVVLYTFLGLVALVMSMSGLYSLISLHLQKQTKELGVRKILGASFSSILLRSSALFFAIIGISFVLGTLAGSFMVNKLMDNIWEYYEAIDSVVIATAGLLIFVISGVTVFAKIRHVVKTNPVDSLRYE